MRSLSKLISEDIPPLIEEYQDQLIIIGVDVTNPAGQQLYLLAVEYFNVPDRHHVVPLLIVGENYLVGGEEIPKEFPGIIDSGLSSGGIDWPNIPELTELINEEITDQVNVTEDEEISTVKSNDTSIANDPGEIMPRIEDETASSNSVVDKFTRDTAGNSVAVIVLVGMLISVGYIGYSFIKDTSHPKPWPNWTILVLAIIGLGVAIYMTFIETTQTEAVCGPVGDCNSVQQSKYAVIFGFLPIGIIGIFGYLLIFAALIVRQISSSENIKNIMSLGMWGMAWLGVLFSIYLTFLEPFVIGATCMWCITSAIVMTMILIGSTPEAKCALATEEDVNIES